MPETGPGHKHRATDGVRRSGNLDGVERFERAARRYSPPGMPYLGLLDRIHRHLLPRTYAEIGVNNGSSLTLAVPGTICVGIDPSPDVRCPVRRRTRVFKQSSDEFFDQHDLARLFGGLPVDLAFIDGMHHFEFALRDFMNLEKASDEEGTILIHDCLPVSEITARRDRTTNVWSGDVWKLIVLLRQWRPDLRIEVIDVAPTGLGVIRGLDPTSTVLDEHYDKIVDEYLPQPYEDPTMGSAPARMGPIASDWTKVSSLLPIRPFRRNRAHFVEGWQAARYSSAIGRRTLKTVRLGMSQTARNRVPREPDPSNSPTR